MKLLKFLVLLFAIGIGAYFLFWLLGGLLGFLTSILWYAFWIGIIAIGAGVGYKLFLSGDDEETPRLEERQPTAISEFENVDRALEEMKKKYLNE